MSTTSSQPLLQSEENLAGFSSSASSAYLLEQAIGAATNGIIITDCNQPNNPIIYVNPGFERITGYSAQEVLGRNCRFLQGTDTNQPALVELREALAARRALTVVLRNYRKDGTRFYNELCISPVYNPQNQLTHFMSVQTDVTARIEAEETLRKRQERYRKLVSKFPNGAVLLFDSDLRYFQVEGSGFVQEGKREALLGKTIQEIVPPETYQILAPPYRAALRGESSTIELNFQDHYYLMHIAPLEDEEPGTAAGMVIIQDVTELKRAQAQSQQLERQLTATLESMNDAFFTLDKDWRFTYLNTEAEKIFACSRDELLHHTLWKKIPDMVGTSFERIYRQVVAEQIPAHVEEYYPAKESWYDVRAYPTSDGGLTVYCRNITARKEAETLLVRNEHKFRALIENSTEMITMTGSKGQVLYQSPSVATILGYTVEELAGKNSFDFVHPDDVAHLISQQRKLVAEPGLRHQNEFRFRHRDGTWHYMETDARNLLHVPGIEAIIVNGHDVTARKRVELALRRSEEMLNFALDAARVGTWDYTVQTGQIEWSAQVAGVLGFTPGDFDQTYSILKKRIWPGDRETLVQTIRQPLVEGADYHLECRLVNPDSQVVWLEWRGRSYYDRPGQSLRISGVVEDVTRRKQIEAALQESEARFVTFMEHTPAPAFILDNSGRFVYVNRAYRQLFELNELGDLAGRYCSDVFPPEVSARHREHDQQVLATGQLLEEAETWTRSDGSTAHWLGYKFPMHDASGHPLVGGVGLNVTAVRQVEEALRLSEVRLASIINSATDGIITLDSRQRIVVFNAAAAAMFDCSAEEVQGASLSRFLPERYRAAHEHYISLFAQTGTSVRSMGNSLRPLMALRRNGEEFPIEATISQVATAGQNYYTVIIRDVTERKKAEEALAISEAQLRQSQKMEAVGQLAGGVAHDFNNLLTVIMGYGEIILTGLNERDPLYEDIGEIVRAAQRASNLTRQLLAFSRQQVLQPSLLDLNEVVGEMNRMLHRLIGENIELITFPAEKLALVQADRGQLEQVIVNLAVNARDAMPGGGKLIFETSNIELTDDYVLYHPDSVPGSYVRLAVSDTGQGMSEAVRSRLFEPFFTTKERGRGTGLGLSMVYGIVKQSGGNIELYSEEGRGSTFKIYLPVAEGGAVENNLFAFGKNESVSPTLRPVHETVMLVEDEDGVRNLAARILEQYGYDVIVARHGGEAVLLCERHHGKIDLLITDMVMPQLGGAELRQRLAPLQPNMEVLYMSGYTDQLMLEQSMLSQSEMLHNFLHKPFSPQSLVVKVREILDRKSQA